MIATAGEALGGFAALLIGLGIIFVAVVWILFPIMVWIKLNELLKAVQNAEQRIHRALLAANTVRDEIAKALQWMVNNWRKD
jgi:F0F1-type ATP synthase membrane subunit b/b'